MNKDTEQQAKQFGEDDFEELQDSFDAAMQALTNKEKE